MYSYQASHSWCYGNTGRCPAPWRRAVRQTCWVCPCCCRGTDVESRRHMTGSLQRNASAGSPARSPAAAQTQTFLNHLMRHAHVDVFAFCMLRWHAVIGIPPLVTIIIIKKRGLLTALWVINKVTVSPINPVTITDDKMRLYSTKEVLLQNNTPIKG